MTDKHLSTQFDAELSGISTRVLEMGGLVESQVAQAVVRADPLQRRDRRAGAARPRSASTQMEVEIDRDLSTIIARRQPTARDLRLLIAIAKTIANLERVGDEAARIARTVQRLINAGVSSRLRLPVADLAFEADLAIAQLRKALDAFARLDVDKALEVLKAGRPDRPGVRRPDAQADHLHDGRPAHHLGAASTWCSWPRRSSASATTPRTWPRRSSTSSRAPTCATTRWRSVEMRCAAMQEHRMSRVLVVEDESAIAELIAINLRHAGYEVTLAADAEQAQAAVDARAARPGAAGLDAAGPERAGAGAALARRRAHARPADHHADGARRRGRQDRRPGRRRRRLPDQAVLDATSCWRASAPCCGARRREALDAAVEVARPAAGPGHAPRDASRGRRCARSSSARPSSACCTS